MVCYSSVWSDLKMVILKGTMTTITYTPHNSIPQAKNLTEKEAHSNPVKKLFASISIFLVCTISRTQTEIIRHEKSKKKKGDLLIEERGNRNKPKYDLGNETNKQILK